MDAADKIYSGKEGLSMAAVFLRLICEETGQGVAEYAIIVATVALLVVGAISVLGLTVQALFEVPFPELK
jgi:Flp pilus assembly pilin Flp